jgi:hypothetical protein
MHSVADITDPGGRSGSAEAPALVLIGQRTTERSDPAPMIRPRPLLPPGQLEETDSDASLKIALSPSASDG